MSALFEAHPWAASLMWVGAQLVFGVLGYIQGKRDEELKWRRACGTSPKAIGFRGQP